MKEISRFEANLVRLTRGIVQQTPKEQMRAILAKPLPRPACLSADAVALIEEALGKGCVHFLARRGWMRERFLRAGRVAEGRLWGRCPPEELGLTFSRHTLEFLLQLTSGTLGKTLPRPTELAIGDRFVFFLAMNALRHTDTGEELTKTWTPLHQDGLCRLAFLEELAEGTQRFRIEWSVWTTGLGPGILETLQGWLAERWIEVERKKAVISTSVKMRKIGATQERVFGEYLAALEFAERRDLARSFLEAGRILLTDERSSRHWISQLDLSRERLADRKATCRDALAFVRQLDRLQSWQQQALSVGYFDEGYAASQLWKADWEGFGGERLCQRACLILREVAPM